MEREVRYCTTEDGVKIAYCVDGEGPALLRGGDIASFTEDISGGGFASLTRSLAHGRRFVEFDPRGVGLSDRDPPDMSHAGHVRDLEAVVAAIGAQCSIYASALTGPAAIEYTARHPERVGKLILYGTCARFADVFPQSLVEGMANMALTNFDLAVQMMTVVDPEDRLQAPELERSFIDIAARSITPKTMARYLLEGYESDVTSSLSQISVPALILHRMGDPTIPFEESKKLHAAIPGARFVPLSGASHQPGIGDWQSIGDAINRFLGDGGGISHALSGHRALAAVRTVLFTDLVGHTEMMSRLGDERGRAVLREHERITRDVLKAHVGTEVKAMGDGFMASFGSVTKAVECAVALQRAFAEREGEPLSVRVGLNAGEPIEEDGDLFGATVILASRIAAKAEGGEILVADTVRGLCSGKGFLFADRGEFVAKGFEEPVRVYEVSWRE